MTYRVIEQKVYLDNIAFGLQLRGILREEREEKARRTLQSLAPVLLLDGRLEVFLADVGADFLDERQRVAAQIDTPAHRQAGRAFRGKVR